MRITKLHGAGNDWVLIDAREQDADWPALAQTMCDRHFGVGADGLLLVVTSDKVPIGMRILNLDGSEALKPKGVLPVVQIGNRGPTVNVLGILCRDPGSA